MPADPGSTPSPAEAAPTRQVRSASVDALGPDFEPLIGAPLDQLQEQARRVRDEAHGNRITFSPKVFIPLTMLCRDRCGYCTFAKAPAHLESPYLSLEQVLDIARAGRAAGCHEALFTLGEAPEERYPSARAWLDDHGWTSTVDYLVAACRAVVEETGMLPHANAGALDADELARLRAVTASQGMMIESVNPDLEAHRSAPDKTPARRLATLEAAGRAAIPFTTGLLVGIGESRADRLATLEAIAASHRRHGHVQEVIVQNFLPKAGTSMHRSPPCPTDEFLWTVAAARLVLPTDIHLQAPPNLSDDLTPLIDSGIDDWGGVSPVTADHVNPERAWPALGILRDTTESAGCTLAPRLTLYPTFALAPDRWLDPSMRFAVLDASDAEGLGRDHPWCSGGEAPPPELLGPVDSVRRPTFDDTGARDGSDGPGSSDARDGTVPEGNPAAGRPPVAPLASAGSAVGEVLAGVLAGQSVDEDEIVTLFGARGPEVRAVAAVADQLRHEAVGDEVTFVHNRNINYTNVCTFKCKFCAFSKGPLSLNLRGSPYLLELSEISDRVRQAEELGATEVCLQGGIHPDFDGEYYLHVIRAVREASATIHIHGFTALEVTEGARRSELPLADYLVLLRDAGLKTLPGTAAEILDDPVRAVLCPDKITTEEWLFAHRTAHQVGLRSNVTIMFGAVEQPRSWARHLVRTRQLQLETGGFTEFVPLPFVHMATPIYLQHRSRRGPTFRETLLMHAVGRIAYRHAIENIQVSWVKMGADGVRQILRAGVNDLGGTLMDENISRAAGASHGQMMDAERFAAIVHPLGRSLAQRTTLYGRVEGPGPQTEILAAASG
ncbi:MAG: 5-amino-6-(D-ribitylamino)uracil--L-tyrosine 4-hydroxyphenyl transferase CofH [Acidimicrobiales bacterium]|jgi:FO synthase